MSVNMKNAARKFKFDYRLALAVILAIAIFLRISNLNFNTAFIDESNYILIGKLFLTGGPAQFGNPYSFVFSSYLPMILLGAAGSLGGLAGARAINGLFGIVTIIFIYLTAKYAYGKRASLLAALVASIYGPFVFLGEFATYDSLCIMFISISLYFLIRGSAEKSRKLIAISCASLALAVVSEYIALVFLPYFAVYACYKSRTNLKIFIAAAVIPLIAYFLAISSSIHELIAGQIIAVHLFGSPLLDVADTALAFSIVLIVFSILGVWKSRSKISMFLFIGALIIPAVQIAASDGISVAKHVAFSIIFLAPLAGAAASEKWNFKGKDISIALIGCLLALLAVTSAIQLNYLEHSYPNESPVNKFLESRVNTSTKILSEGWSNAFALQDKVKLSNVIGSYWFDYKHDNKTTVEDYTQAVRDKYFDYIVLYSGFFSPVVCSAVSNTIRDYGTYALVYNITDANTKRLLTVYSKI